MYEDGKRGKEIPFMWSDRDAEKSCHYTPERYMHK